MWRSSFFIALLSVGLHADRPLAGLDMKDFLSIPKSVTPWKLNPFARTSDDLGVDELTLLAIVYNKKKSAALINDRIVKVGDKIGLSEVVAIEKQEVILRNEAGIFKLSFRGKKK